MFSLLHTWVFSFLSLDWVRNTEYIFNWFGSLQAGCWGLKAYFAALKPKMYLFTSVMLSCKLSQCGLVNHTGINTRLILVLPLGVGTDVLKRNLLLQNTILKCSNWFYRLPRFSHSQQTTYLPRNGGCGQYLTSISVVFARPCGRNCLIMSFKSMVDDI